MSSNKTTFDCPEAKHFEQIYKEAYCCIDNGITLVTQGKKDESTKFLQQGLKLLDDALSHKVEAFNLSPEQIQLYLEMQAKMRCTRKEVMNHFSDCQVNTNNIRVDAPVNAPPSYDDYVTSLHSEGKSSSSINYPSLDGLSNTNSCNPGSSNNFSLQSPKSGEMIFMIENGVQIFFIYANGRVTSPSYPSFLAIFTVSEPICATGENGSLGARGILQVGEWTYPLVPAHSPVLHSFYGSYMFPDPSNSEPGTSVGIIIPDKCDKETRETFEQILIQMTSYQEQQVPKDVDAAQERASMEKSAGERISEGAEYISSGVAWGTEKLGSLITFGSGKLKEKLTPEENPKTIDPKWQKTAKVARDVSGSAVKISSFLVNQVGKATMALGRTVAPSIRKHGTKAIGHFTGKADKEASSQVDGMLEVASGAVKGASTIYVSLEQAAYNLTNSLAQNTVSVVSHKYGDEAAALTDNALYAVGQSASAGYNVSSLGVKGIAKKTAKDTGKALLLKDEKKVKSQSPDLDCQMEVYPKPNSTLDKT